MEGEIVEGGLRWRKPGLLHTKASRLGVCQPLLLWYGSLNTCRGPSRNTGESDAGVSSQAPCIQNPSSKRLQNESQLGTLSGSCSMRTQDESCVAHGRKTHPYRTWEATKPFFKHVPHILATERPLCTECPAEMCSTPTPIFPPHSFLSKSHCFDYY